MRGGMRCVKSLEVVEARPEIRPAIPANTNVHFTLERRHRVQRRITSASTNALMRQFRNLLKAKQFLVSRVRNSSSWTVCQRSS